MPAFDRFLRASLDGADLATQRAVLAECLAVAGVSPDGVTAVLERTRDGIVLSLTALPERRSRVCGPPLLPAGEPWPLDPSGRPLTFIAAFDLAELPSLSPLPADGHLLVYWCERFHELDRLDLRRCTRIFHTVEPVPARSPDSVGVLPAQPLAGRLMPVVGEYDRIAAVDGDQDALEIALDALAQLADHHLLGASRDIQGPVLDELPYWLDHAYPDTRSAYDDAELAGDGWVLLSQIGWTHGLALGDAGALYLAIPEDDLAARRFDRVVGIMQCS